MNNPKDHPAVRFAILSTFYCQELLLDSATPGKLASERLVTTAKLLRDLCESMLVYWNLNAKELMEEIHRDNPDHARQHQERVKRAAGR